MTAFLPNKACSRTRVRGFLPAMVLVVEGNAPAQVLVFLVVANAGVRLPVVVTFSNDRENDK